MKIEDKIDKYLKEDFDIYGFSAVGDGMDNVPEPEYDENSFENDLFDKMSELIYSLDDSQLSEDQLILKNEIIEEIGDNVSVDSLSGETVDDYNEFYEGCDKKSKVKKRKLF